MTLFILSGANVNKTSVNGNAVNITAEANLYGR